MTPWNSLHSICVSHSRDASGTPAVIDTAGSATWSDLAGRVEDLRDSFHSAAGGRVALQVPASAEGIAAMAACDALGCLTFLLDPARAIFSLRTPGRERMPIEDRNIHVHARSAIAAADLVRMHG